MTKHTQDKAEYKALPSFTKDIDGRTVVGIASVFGNIDSYGDIVHKGSFKKSIEEGARRVKHLWQHDYMAPPIAAIKSLDEVGRGELPEEIRKLYPEAKGGLQVTREYLQTDRATEILEGIKAGAISEMSFAFNPVKVDFDDVEAPDGGKVNVRNIRELKLWDTSDVVWGANEATSAAKSPLDYRLMQLRSFLQSVNSEKVFDHFVNRGDDKEQLIKELDQLMILLRAEPPKALTPNANLLAQIQIAKRKFAGVQL
jgi:HK97 family phage prohead protease